MNRTTSLLPLFLPMLIALVAIISGLMTGINTGTQSQEAHYYYYPIFFEPFY